MPQPTPTAKELQALQYIKNGDSPRQAMMKAGYSKYTASNPTNNLFRRIGVLNTLEKYQLELENQGITVTYLVEKHKQLLEATKPIIDMKTGEVIAEVADSKTQLEALKLAQENVEIKNNKQESNLTPTRKWEFTEWVSQDSKQGDNIEAISSEMLAKTADSEVQEEYPQLNEIKEDSSTTLPSF